jgi:hypothetical protein
MAGGENGVPQQGPPLPGWPGGNRILDALGEADAALLLPHLEPLRLEPGQILGPTGGMTSHVLFPCRPAVVSLLAACGDGRVAEVVAVGGEGLIGPGLLDLPGLGHLQVQMPGTALRIDAARLAELSAGSAVLRDGLAQQERALLVRVVHMAIDAALHPVEARVSGWLLMAQDRVGQAELPVTQELIAELLAVRRTTVTRVMAQLSRKGLIRHRRSRVTVIDRAGLEEAAAGCHERLLQRLRHVAPALYPA